MPRWRWLARGSGWSDFACRTAPATPPTTHTLKALAMPRWRWLARGSGWSGFACRTAPATPPTTHTLKALAGAGRAGAWMPNRHKPLCGSEADASATQSRSGHEDRSSEGTQSSFLCVVYRAVDARREASRRHDTHCFNRCSQHCSETACIRQPRAAWLALQPSQPPQALPPLLAGQKMQTRR
jgi:hypothetical protein